MGWGLSRQATHEVSLKLALYSHDGKRVLLMKYPYAYGLPGGHLEHDELPEAGLRRELKEELAVEIGPVEKADFFLRNGDEGSVILGYTARATKDIALKPTNPKKEIGVWVTPQELENIEKFSPSYRQMVLENWPKH